MEGGENEPDPVRCFSAIADLGQSAAVVEILSCEEAGEVEGVCGFHFLIGRGLFAL